MKFLATLTLVAALATAFAACGQDAATPTPAPIQTSRPATAPTGATTFAGTATTSPLTATATPASRQPTTPAPESIATLAADRKFELAPIDGAEIVVRESAPPQYAVHITSGLPSGCAEFADATASRTGDEITIAVRNTLPADARIACTQIYGTHEATVELGSDFVRGTTYRVHVNDKTIKFTAQ